MAEETQSADDVASEGEHGDQVEPAGPAVRELEEQLETLKDQYGLLKARSAETDNRLEAVSGLARAARPDREALKAVREASTGDIRDLEDRIHYREKSLGDLVHNPFVVTQFIREFSQGALSWRRDKAWGSVFTYKTEAYTGDFVIQGYRIAFISKEGKPHFATEEEIERIFGGIHQVGEAIEVLVFLERQLVSLAVEKKKGLTKRDIDEWLKPIADRYWGIIRDRDAQHTALWLLKDTRRGRLAEAYRQMKTRVGRRDARRDERAFMDRLEDTDVEKEADEEYRKRKPEITKELDEVKAKPEERDAEFKRQREQVLEDKLKEHLNRLVSEIDDKYKDILPKGTHFESFFYNSAARRTRLISLKEQLSLTKRYHDKATRKYSQV